MKKYVKWILLLIMMLVIPSLLPDCCYNYHANSIVRENIRYETNSFFSRCLATSFEWPEGQNSITLSIPDKVDGYRVISLGGFVGSGAPAPFMPQIPGTQMVYSEGTLPEDAVVEQYHMTLVLGKYVRETRFVGMDMYYYMGDGRYIQILVTVDPGENTYYGVKDGRLYYKADGQVVKGFFYTSDYVTK